MYFLSPSPSLSLFLSLSLSPYLDWSALGRDGCEAHDVTTENGHMIVVLCLHVQSRLQLLRDTPGSAADE